MERVADAGRPLLYTGVHRPFMAAGLPRAMLSANVLLERQSDFEVADWILDSGAFTRISQGREHLPVETYAELAERWAACGNLQAVVQQDWMCEPFVLERTGLSVAEHQSRTTENLLEMVERLSASGLYVMPVLQGFRPEEYVAHLRNLSEYLPVGSWVGLGSVCKRQGRPGQLSAILSAVLAERPDLRLHGFGVKTTALREADIASRLYSVDSMAWSYSGRHMTPQRGNDPAWCREWTEHVQTVPMRASQMGMF